MSHLTAPPATYDAFAIWRDVPRTFRKVTAPEALRLAYTGTPIYHATRKRLVLVTLAEVSEQHGVAESDALLYEVGASPSHASAYSTFWSTSVMGRRAFLAPDTDGSLAFLADHAGQYAGYMRVDGDWHHVGYDAGYDEYVLRDVTLGEPREHMRHYFYEHAYARDDYATAYEPDAFKALLTEHPLAPLPGFK